MHIISMTLSNILRPDSSPCQRKRVGQHRHNC